MIANYTLVNDPSSWNVMMDGAKENYVLRWKLKLRSQDSNSLKYQDIGQGEMLIPRRTQPSQWVTTSILSNSSKPRTNAFKFTNVKLVDMET